MRSAIEGVFVLCLFRSEKLLLWNNKGIQIKQNGKSVSQKENLKEIKEKQWIRDSNKYLKSGVLAQLCNSKTSALE